MFFVRSVYLLLFNYTLFVLIELKFNSLQAIIVDLNGTTESKWFPNKVENPLFFTFIVCNSMNFNPIETNSVYLKSGRYTLRTKYNSSWLDQPLSRFTPITDETLADPDQWKISEFADRSLIVRWQFADLIIMWIGGA